MTKKDIGIGLVGIGAGTTALALNDHPESHMRVVALCDQSGPRARAAGHRHKVPFVTTDYMDLLALPGVDVVALLSHDGPLFDQCMAALLSGKHVICLEPPGASLAQALEVAREVDRHGLMLIAGPLDRWQPEAQAARELLASGELGDLRMADIWFHPAASTDHAPIGRLGRPIALLRWLAGDITEVQAVSPRMNGNADVAVHTLHQSGAVGRAAILDNGAGSAAAHVKLALVGTRGSVDGDRVVLDRIPGRPTLTFQLDGCDCDESPLLRALFELEAGLNGGPAIGHDHWDAAQTSSVCQAVRESLETGLPTPVTAVGP